MEYTKEKQEAITRRITIMQCIFKGIDTGVIEQNAKKYKAAPELYEALKAFLAIKYPPDVGDWLTEAFPEAHEMAQEALAKAEGK